MQAAVLTGDIVNSTRLNPAQTRSLMARLKKLLAPFTHQFFRGDSFQIFVPQAAEALRLALQCRCEALKQNKEIEFLADIRIGIGIGQAAHKPEDLAMARGEVFILSGHAFDRLNPGQARLAMAATQPLVHTALQIAAGYADSLMHQRTARQAEVLFELLRGKTQQQTATILNRANSTIHQHAAAARWTELETLISHYENLIKLIP